MSDETNAVVTAPTAAPVETPQENTAPSANAETQPVEGETPEQQQARDERGRFKSEAQNRINELTRARRQAERERDALMAEVERYRQPQQTAPADKPPAFEDFQDLNQWAAAVAQHARQSALTEAERKFSERQQQTSQEQVFGQYEARERQYAAAHPDYAEAIDSLRSSVRFAPSTLEVIATSEHGPAVVHHLGKHLDEADRLARMPPHMQAAEVARIEARVSAPKPKPVTKAPDPAPSLSGGAPAPKGLSDDLPIEEWVARRREQLKR